MVKLSPKKLTVHFWDKDSGLTSMLILLFVSNFLVMPFFSERPVVSLLMRAFWFFLLIAGITTLSRNKKHIKFLIFVPILFVLVSVLGYFLDYPCPNTSYQLHHSFGQFYSDVDRCSKRA